MYPLWCRDCRIQMIYRAVDTIALTILYSFLYVVGGQVAVSLPFSPVPVTLHTLVAFILPLFVGWKAVAAYGWYLLLDLAGLPVFDFGLGGLDLVLGPSGGYLIGMGLAVLFLASVRRFCGSRWVTLPIILFAAQTITVVVGLWQLSFFVESSKLLAVGLWPFLAGAIYKTTIALLSVSVVQQFRGRLALIR